MGELIATAIGGPAAGQAVAAHKASGGPMEAAPLQDAGSLLPQMPGPQQSMPDASVPQPTQIAQAQTPNQDAMFGQTRLPQGTIEENPQPVDNPYAPDTAKEIVVQGDDWKPKHESFLGQIGDFLLMRRGMQPVFRQRTDEANLKSAMQGFQKDPETAISRVRQVDPELAAKLQEQQSRVNANNALTQQREAARMQQGSNVLGSMLGSITKSKDPAAIYSKTLPTMRAYAEAMHFPSDMLPDTYDPDIVGTLQNGGLSVYQQQRLDQYNRGLNSLIQNRQATQDETKRAHMADEAEANRTHTVHEGIAQQNADKNPGNRTFTSQVNFMGENRPAQISADKQTLTVVDRDGLHHVYKNMGVSNGKIRWQLYNSEKPKE